MFSIFYLLFIICSVDIFASETKSNRTILRLTDAIKPLQYDLTISPDFSNFSFKGYEIITISISEPVNVIMIHSKELVINSVKLLNSTGEKLNTSYRLYFETEYLSITAHDDNELAAGSVWKVIIDFYGQLNDEMIGFYRSSYKVGNMTKWLALTQFEPNYARRAFPCFDEPRFKAKFIVNLYTEPHHFAASNMPVANESVINSKKLYQFYNTLPMPTYLLAFMVSESGVTKTDASKKFRIWTRETAIQDAVYALNVGPKCLEAMENYTSISYMMPKMDLISLPDMDAGAMENWGMITFREQAILFNEYLSSTMDLQEVTLTIAHEIVHQWFGNFITPYWWDSLWLNEGFARYFEHKITGMIHTDWRIENYFVTDVLQPVLFQDGAQFHHAMTSPVLKYTEISQKFDAITYDKGASVLRMLEHMVSSEVFKNASRQYLVDRHKANSLAEPSDLWAAFDMQLKDRKLLPGNISIADIMTKWTTYIGYPLLTIHREQKSQTLEVVINQQPYNASNRGSSLGVSWQNQSWIVPISYTTQSTKSFVNTQPSLWLLPGQKAVIREHILPNQWIVLNLQQTGYYRINYDSENWELLIKQLTSDPTAIHVLNRASLIDDSWSMAEDNIISYRVPVELIKYLRNEVDVLPWFPALRHFKYVYSLFEDTDVEESLRDFILEQLAYPYNRLGFDVKNSDDHSTKILRISVISLACRLKFRDCNEHAERIYKNNLRDLSKIPADVKKTVFCSVLDGMTFRLSDVWNSLWKLYSNSNSGHEKYALLKAAACVKSSHHLEMYLQKLVNHDSDIRKQDYVVVYGAVLSTPYGIIAALQLAVKLAENLTNIEPHAMRVLVHIIKQMQQKITNQKQLKLLEKLHSAFITYVGDENKKQYIKAINIAYESGLRRVELIQIKTKDIGDLLPVRQKSSSSSLEPFKSTWMVIACWVSYLFISSIKHRG